MFLKLRLLALITLIAIGLPYAAKAQPQLPDMAAVTQNGVNILTWQCQYEGIKSIAVQRSGDSITNYTTIGYVKNLKKGLQAFIDGHPKIGKNYYRLYIVFSSDLTWYSNTTKLFVDSLTIAKGRVLPPNDSLQKFINTKAGTILIPPNSVSGNNNGIAVEVPNLGELQDISYVRSAYVFTNPFTGHINVQLPDIEKEKYTLIFFDTKNQKILELTKMPRHSFVIDKRNFQSKGVFRFDLRKSELVKETGHITIY